MNKKTVTLLLCALAVFGMVFVTACAEQSPIKSADDVRRTVENVSTSVDRVSSILGDVDATLGGS